MQTKEKAEKARVKAIATAAAQAESARLKAIATADKQEKAAWKLRYAAASPEEKARMKEEADEKKWEKSATPLQIKMRRLEKAADAAAAAAATAARDAFLSGAPAAPPPSSPTTVPSSLKQAITQADIDCRVTVKGYAGEGAPRFVGLHAVSGLPRCGVEFDKPVGKNNGNVKGIAYFKCAEKHGVLTKPENVKIIGLPNDRATGTPVAPLPQSAYETLAATMQEKRACPYVSTSSKGSCKRLFVAGTHVTFCKMHTCTKAGCNAKKTSRDEFCSQHVAEPDEKAPELPPLPAAFAPPYSPPPQPVSHTPISPAPLFDAANPFGAPPAPPLFDTTNPFGPPPASASVNTSTGGGAGDDGEISDDENDYDTCDTATDPSKMTAFANQPSRVSKYVAPEIRLGRQEQTALGLEDLMGVDYDLKIKFLTRKEEAIKQEFALNGTEEDQDNLKHVLAGTYRKDWGRSVAESVALETLLTSEEAKTAKLAYHHVLALRLYTTSSYKRVNEPLREDPPPKPHPFAATTYFIQEGIKMLRAVDAKCNTITEERIFWRGMHGRSLPPSFKDEGGAEFACMSTTADFEVAVKFAQVETSDKPMLFKYVTDNSLVRGADISFLSVYPEEKEVLYPPLTYLQQISVKRHTIRGKRVVIVEVKPQMA